ncbi:MAG TPA: FecR domain-containing protein [Polyangiales bacterium]|nr:FecR domain-containing protein [Polyangiales bacterium]
MSEPTKLAEFVVPELNKSRLDGQWARISEQLHETKSERKRSGALIPTVGILVAACALGVVWWPRDARVGTDSVWEGSVVASDDAPVEMTLAEGTHIQVEPRSEVKLLHSSQHAVQVRLGHGSARFQVAKKRTRRFSVDLGKVEVVVTGTQFRVTRRGSSSGDRVQVQVTEGSVEVHRDDGGLVTLHAGEHWSTTVAPQDGEREVEPSQVNNDELDPPSELEESQPAQAEDETASLDDDEADHEVDHARARERAKQRRKRARAEAFNDAGELLDQANLARRAGRLDDAADLYEDLVARYPKDRRASLAAFELGRLRMDSLRDMNGAVRALERALKIDAHGTFAEDALARLVLAQEARGDRQACSRARSRYLGRYPEGVHAAHVSERCGN